MGKKNMRVTNRRILLLDDYIIEEMAGIKRVVHQPDKDNNNPVLYPDKPWEGSCVALCSVIYDTEERVFKMWYQTYNPSFTLPYNAMVCYAVSSDGIAWEKPALNFYEYPGVKKNNIVLMHRGGILDCHCVIKDTSEPDSDKRYKMTYYEGYTNDIPKSGIYGACSPDGIYWQSSPHSLVNAGDRNFLAKDVLRNKYVLLTRPGPLGKTSYRTIAKYESDDFVNWSGGEKILSPDKHDPPETQYYGMVSFSYQNYYLGFLELFHITSRKIDTELVFSRDGQRWKRTAKRDSFLPCGAWGEFDYAWAFPANSMPVRCEEELHFWYEGRKSLHWKETPFYPCGAIGRAILRVDGFCSLKAEKEGFFITKPVIIDGDFLVSNVSSENGYLDVAVTTPEGKDIEGFSRNDFDRISEDSTYRKLTWQRSSDVKLLAERPVRIKFFIKNAEIYSLWAGTGLF
ncbi:MAG: hypothetical protein PHV82_07865 [Victivallaceae bacterium]|nr:hypothetical protein [Victivallaceae bacterium]